MRCVTFCKVGINPTVPKFVAMLCRVIGSVCVEGRRALLWMAGFTSDGWRAVDKWQKLSRIVTVGPRQNRVEWNSIRIGQHMVFTSWFAPICGIRACFSASADGPNRGTVHRGT